MTSSERVTVDSAYALRRVRPTRCVRNAGDAQKGRWTMSAIYRFTMTTEELALTLATMRLAANQLGTCVQSTQILELAKRLEAAKSYEARDTARDALKRIVESAELDDDAVALKRIVEIAREAL